MSASGSIVSAAKLRNMELMPTAERSRWNTGRPVRATASGPIVQPPSTNSGTMAKAERKNTVCPPARRRPA